MMRFTGKWDLSAGASWKNLKSSEELPSQVPLKFKVNSLTRGFWLPLDWLFLVQ